MVLIFIPAWLWTKDSTVSAYRVMMILQTYATATKCTWMCEAVIHTCLYWTHFESSTWTLLPDIHSILPPVKSLLLVKWFCYWDRKVCLCLYVYKMDGGFTQPSTSSFHTRACKPSSSWSCRQEKPAQCGCLSSSRWFNETASNIQVCFRDTNRGRLNLHIYETKLFELTHTNTHIHIVLLWCFPLNALHEQYFPRLHYW